MSQSEHIDFLSWLSTQKQIYLSFFLTLSLASFFFFFFSSPSSETMKLLLALSRRVAQAPQAAAAATRFPFLEISRDFPDFHWLVFPFSLQVATLLRNEAASVVDLSAKMKSRDSILVGTAVMLEIQASGTLFHDPMFFLQTNRTTILIPSQAQSSGTKLCTIWT